MMIRLMIVHNQDKVRKELAGALEGNKSIEVVCKIGPEKEMEKMIGWISPDLLLVDVKAFEDCEAYFFESLIKKRVPVMLIYEKGFKGRERLMEILSKGAADLSPWPIKKAELIDKVLNIAKARPILLTDRHKLLKFRFPRMSALMRVVVVASSTGGPQALRHILSNLPEDLPFSLVVIQHMSKGFSSSLARSLDRLCKIKVKEAAKGDILKKGVAYVAPYGYHLYFEDKRIQLEKAPPIHGVIPSADYTMKSAAANFGEEAVGLVLTGMGRDGARGLRYIKKSGGRTLVQDRESSVIFGMPHAALETGMVDRVVELENIPNVLVKEVFT